jgi:hypothetical protein
MKKLLQYFLISVALLRPTKKVLQRYSIYSLITIVSLVGLYRVIDNHQIQQQIKIQEKISQIKKEIEDSKKIISAESIRMVAINKISKIIKMHNDLPEFGRREDIQPQVVFQSNIQDSTVIQIVYLDTLSQRIFGRYDYANEIYEMTLKYDNLDIDLISALITQESAWKSNIESHAGALGLMQIMPATGQFLVRPDPIKGYEGIEWTNKEDILFNPLTNIRLGSKYLSDLIEQYSIGMNREHAVEAALAAYNGGQRRVRRYLANNRNFRYLAKETRNYIPRILAFQERYGSM